MAASTLTGGKLSIVDLRRKAAGRWIRELLYCNRVPLRGCAMTTLVVTPANTTARGKTTHVRAESAEKLGVTTIRSWGARTSVPP